MTSKGGKETEAFKKAQKIESLDGVSGKSFEWKPLHSGLLGATLLFLLYIPRWLTGLSAMGGSFAFDYFTLPRCGLAVRNGTDYFSSSQDYSFGYHATNWASHPLMCYVFGVPLSFTSPWVGFWLSTFLYFLLHCWILWRFAKCLSAEANRDWTSHVTFASLGLFYPWYLNYHLGQYHLIFVAALALVLTEKRVSGFVTSALGKPALAPAALCLVAVKDWKSIAWIGAICVLGYAPFLFDFSGGSVSLNKSFLNFFQISSLYSHYSVRGWDQELGWSKVMDEIWAGDHYPLRMALTLFCAFGGAFLARRSFPLGVGFASLWFFFSYGRIHEYHYATFVPLLAWACTNPHFSKKGVAAAAFWMGTPTVWAFLTQSEVYSKGALDFGAARAAEPFLFWTWMLHKPLGVLLVAGLFVAAWKRMGPKNV